MEFGLLGLIPPFIALLAAILVGGFLISGYHPHTTLLLMAERFWELLSELWVLKTLAFAMIVGSVMTLIESSITSLAGAIGGVFGDHCSPISDTTIISSMASGCSVQEHVKTQLPYALISAGRSLLLFIGAGLLIA